ncbi:hypothetical protein ACLB1Q_07325 [Escherichia coli]
MNSPEFAASLVQPGETIFIENGSSNALLARTGGAEEKCHYHHGQQLHRAFAEDAPCELFAGGVYQKKSESMVGPLTRQCIQQVHFSKAFIGIDGWQPKPDLPARDDAYRCGQCRAGKE